LGKETSLGEKKKRKTGEEEEWNLKAKKKTEQKGQGLYNPLRGGGEKRDVPPYC